MEDKLNIALIGCGNWGKYILRDLIQLGCNVHVVCRSEESIARAQAGGACSIVNNIKELPNVDGVVIATTTITHLDIIEEVEHLNAPIYIEKPLGVDVDHATQIVNRIGERLFVMDKWRYHEGILELAKIARNKELGEVKGLSLVRTGWQCPHQDVDCVWILAPHDLSIALEILGEIPKPIHANATRWNDEIVTLNASLGTSPWVNLTVSKLYPKYRREVRLECENGFALLSDAYVDSIEIYPKENIGISNPEEAVIHRNFKNEFPLLRELDAFTHFIKGGSKPKSNAYEALEIVKTIAHLREVSANNPSRVTAS